MASAQRKPNHPLIQQLLDQGERFSFFQAVQLLHRLSPNLKPVGETAHPSREVVRFKVNPYLDFPAGDIAQIKLSGEGSHHAGVEIVTNFLGLIGASSPLAFSFTEDVVDAEIEEQHSLLGFYDLFHHRLLSLYFRAWKKYRFASNFRSDGSDSFTRRSLAFVGVDLGAKPSQDSLPSRVLLNLAPILALRSRSAHTLEAALRRLLPNVGVEVQSFVERKVRIHPDQRVQLGIANCALGQSFTIGKHVRDRSGRFRVKIGPVDYDDFEALMPGGSNYPLLRQVVNQFTSGILEPELQVDLTQAESPKFQLGNRRGARLGATTQLATERKRPMRMRVVLTENAEDAMPQLVPDQED